LIVKNAISLNLTILHYVLSYEDLSQLTEQVPMEEQLRPGKDNALLIVEDDVPFLNRLTRAMEARGFTVKGVTTVAEGLRSVALMPPAYAVVDMRLEDGNGLDVVEALRKKRPEARSIVLTGYGNIASAVVAVKLGAVDYLAKPADADDVAHALLRPREEKAPPPENPMSADRVRWEHIQRVFELCDRNVSETARRLSMHRRTLQRILAKRAPR
jgi:two-component system response regulator RegA